MSLILVAGWAGCAEGGESPVQRSDPEAVSKAFIRAVAAADPQACDSLTPDAAAFVKDASGEVSCERAIARTKYVERTFYGTPPADLTKKLDAAHLQETNEGANFGFCTPTDVEVKLELKEGEGGWLIDLVQASYVSKVTAGGVEKRSRCNPVPRGQSE